MVYFLKFKKINVRVNCERIFHDVLNHVVNDNVGVKIIQIQSLEMLDDVKQTNDCSDHHVYLVTHRAIDKVDEIV